jgi:hypothetical protein
MTTDNTYHKDLVHSSIGHTVQSVDVLRSGILNVKFSDVSGNSVTMNNWAMSIVLWQVEE